MTEADIEGKALTVAASAINLMLTALMYGAIQRQHRLSAADAAKVRERLAALRDELRARAVGATRI